MVEPPAEWVEGADWDAPDEGLHDAFARIARTRPGRTALITSAGPVGYGELDRAAEEWAARLSAVGVRAGHLVPIVLPRGTDLVVALLSVLKLGAAYSLLDPQWPLARMAAVVGQLDSPVVIAAPGTVEGLPDQVWPPALGDRPDTAGTGGRPLTVVRGTDAACVFFTSGTTGRPKGVVSPHKATARLFQPGTFGRFDAGTVMPLAAAMPWDMFSFELWGALLNGGTCVVVDEPFLTASALRDAVTVSGADTVWLTASLFNLMVDEDIKCLDGLAQIVTGGERLSVRHARRFLEHYPHVALINSYGPVESAMAVTGRRVTVEDCERPHGIPLGRPVPGTRVVVLDGDRVCEVGETGEICIAGDGLASRYLGDPELTAAKFPRIALHGEQTRLYRTGDMGTWAADGLLEFRGRGDRQVKIRGNRVEPSEVERQIEQILPAVKSCRVVARRGSEAEGYVLHAFCTLRRRKEPLRGATAVIAERLPAYQRPATVVVVDALPLTARGKMDEDALMALLPDADADVDVDVDAVAAGGGGGAAEHRAPDGRDEFVRLTSETFASVLGRGSVPSGTSFFELGGTSLTAARVCARVGSKLGRAVPVSWLYRHPTAAALGARLRDAESAGTTAAPLPQDAPVPLTILQAIFLRAHLADRDDRVSYCPMSWLIEGDLDLAALRAAVAAVHARHEPLRAAYTLDPQPNAIVTDHRPPEPQVLAPQPSADSAIDALRDHFRTCAPLALDAADIWRVALVPVAAIGWVLGLVVHHIAFDGWSESVLARDLSDAYAGRRSGAGEGPLAMSVSAAHQAAVSRGVDLDARARQLYEEFRDLPAFRWPAPQEPAEDAGGPGDDAGNAGNPNGHVRSPLSGPLLAEVDARASALGVSRSAVLLSVWARTLAEVCGLDDFAVAAPVNQRDAPGIENTVGCHINMLPLRLRADAVRGGSAGARAVGRLLDDAFARSDVHLIEVITHATKEYGLQLAVQSVFTQQNLKDGREPELELPGASTTYLRQQDLVVPTPLLAEFWPHRAGGLLFTISYQRAHVRDSTADALLERFTGLLAQSVEEPEPEGA